MVLTRSRRLSVCAVLAAALLADCSSYLDRTDTSTFTGNAVEANMAKQIIDPWPAHSRNTRISYDGERMQRSVERYRTNRVTDPSCAQAPSQGGTAPSLSGGTPCAEPPPTPVLLRAGGTEVPRAASGPPAQPQ